MIKKKGGKKKFKRIRDGLGCLWEEKEKKKKKKKEKRREGGYFIMGEWLLSELIDYLRNAAAISTRF